MKVKFNILVQFLFVSIAVSVSSAKAFEKDHPAFGYISPAYKYWLKQSVLMDMKSMDNDSLAMFENLAPISLDDYFSDPNSEWKIGVMKNYHPWYGNEIPVNYSNLVIKQDGSDKSIPTGVHYFIYKTDPDVGPRAIVIPTKYYYWNYRERVTVYYDPANETEIADFNKSISKYAREKNIYRNGILEMSTGGNSYMQAHFLANVSDYHFQWDDLIMEEKVKQLSYDFTEGYLKRLPTYQNQGIESKFGILLHGPPGTGKSFLGQILMSSIYGGAAKDLATMFVVTARHLQSNNNVKLLFEAIGTVGATVLFLEDIDLFGVKNRTKGEPSESSAPYVLLNEFLNGIDGVKANEGLVIVGTTNKVENVDEALTRSERLGIHIYFGLPTFDERREFFNRFGKKHAVWNVDVSDMWLASATEDFSGADIVEVIGIAKREALLENSFIGEDLSLSRDHFTRAIDLVKNDHKTENVNDMRVNGDSQAKNGAFGTDDEMVNAMKRLKSVDDELLSRSFVR